MSLGDAEPIELETELSKVEAWRLHELLRAGYPVPIAERLAADHSVDLHEATRLLTAGCTPELAAEILL